MHAQTVRSEHADFTSRLSTGDRGRAMISGPSKLLSHTTAMLGNRDIYGFHREKMPMSPHSLGDRERVLKRYSYTGWEKFSRAHLFWPCAIFFSMAYFLKNEGSIMNIRERNAGDLQKLKAKARSELHAKQRDRYRAVALALEGRQAQAIMEMLGRSKNFVQRWSYAYRDGGIEAIAARRQTGRPTKLPRQKETQLTQRILAGPTEADDGICALRGRDVQQILEKEFGVKYTLFGVYDLMHRLGLSCLKPRPRHRKNDPEAMQKWLEQAPLLSSAYETKIPTKRSKSGSRMKRESASRER